MAATKSKMDKEIAEASEKAKADVDKQIAAAIAKLDAAKAESAKEVETKAPDLQPVIRRLSRCSDWGVSFFLHAVSLGSGDGPRGGFTGPQGHGRNGLG